jgi:hypothetical protein
MYLTFWAKYFTNIQRISFANVLNFEQGSHFNDLIISCLAQPGLYKNKNGSVIAEPLKNDSADSNSRQELSNETKIIFIELYLPTRR